jgi:L-alanine-DL-glutamate epimerase-like enolase superfamily enzyme
MNAEIHGGDQANVHLACGISNCSFFEVLVFGTDPVDFGYPVEPDGFITAPQEPGIGYIFDWNEIEKKAVYKV